MAAEQPRSSRGDRLKQLRAFCHAARLGSITRAAEHLFTSQPAVSQQVRALEEELGATLFERNGPRISLTGAGRRLYEAGMAVVAGMDRLPDTFAERHRGEMSGELRIGAGTAVAMYVLPRYIKRFRERYPGVRVNLRIDTGREWLERLRSYELDIAFGAMDGPPPPDLRFRFLRSSRIFLITPKVHPLAGRKSVEARELAQYPAIAPRPGSYVRQVADVVVNEHRLPIDVVLEVDGWNVLKRHVEAGVGVALVPEVCLTNRDRVARIPLDRYFANRRYGVLTRREGVPALAAERLIQLTGAGSRSSSR